MNVISGKQNVQIGQYQEFITQLDTEIGFQFNGYPVIIKD
jgi:hypothetical protein